MVQLRERPRGDAGARRVRAGQEHRPGDDAQPGASPPPRDPAGGGGIGASMRVPVDRSPTIGNQTYVRAARARGRRIATRRHRVETGAVATMSDSADRRSRPSWPIRLVEAYQRAFEGRPSPCRFTPSCSAYAHEALHIHGTRRGLWLTARRLLRCRPLGPSGFDPVPDAHAAQRHHRADSVRSPESSLTT